MALKKTRGGPGGGTRGRPEKTLELANDGLGKDETKTQKLRESASPNLKKARIEHSTRSSLPLTLSSLLPSSAFVPHSQLSSRPLFNSVTL